jgi:hypothetical protein
LPVAYVSPGGTFFPSSVEFYIGESLTTAVGTAPQWATEDGDGSYISFLPGGAYAIATFFFTGSEGVPQSWFEDPRIVIQAVSMNQVEVDYTFITMYWANTNTNFYKLRNYYSPVIGVNGVYDYHTNTFDITTPWPGPDTEDPDPGVAWYGLGGYANGATAENWAADAWAAYQAGTFQVSLWVGGGSGEGLPEDEIRVSYFGLVVPGEVPNLTGEFEDKRRKFARGPTRYTP